MLTILILLLITALLFRLCYFFENFSKFEIKGLIAIFVFLFVIVLFTIQISKQIYFVSRLKGNYGLTEGKVTFYKTGRGKSDGEVSYDFKLKDGWFSNSYFENDYVEIPDEKPNTKISYLVIYEQGAPENGFLLFNYPIEEKSDLLEYKKRFEKGIPNDVFYN